MRELVARLDLGKSVLVIVAARDRNVELAGRNLPNVLVLPVEGLNVYDILRHENLLIARDALDSIEGRVAK
jgi:large subunit ribosomal protein L4